MTRKIYLLAPLPFVGQKRMLTRESIKVLEQFPEDTVFADLLGDSGLLSHIAKCRKPNATMVYNDFGNYRRRMAHILQTSQLVADIRGIIENAVSRHRPITRELRERIFRCIKQEERTVGYVDFITLSSSLMFSTKYRLSVPEMRKEALYNNIRRADYPEYANYLDGLEIMSYDYKEVFGRCKDTPGMVFLVNPSYLSVDVGTYNVYWHMSDCLDVLNVFAGHSFVYFTSNKSSILELCEWIERDRGIGDPSEKYTRVGFSTHMNYNASYTDMMLYRKEAV